MEILPTTIQGCYDVLPKVFSDGRGAFVKTFHESIFRQVGLNTVWREHFWSSSTRGTLRGFHFQAPPSDHAKLVSCPAGAVCDVVVDIRRSSATFGKHVMRELTAANGRLLYIPRGMAHGFLALTDGAVVSYAVETVHDSACDRGILWSSCGIDWPLSGAPIISARDAALPALAHNESPF
jgi:dTDP-4-dehydrorhamnose 3,5-epimerase